LSPSISSWWKATRAGAIPRSKSIAQPPPLYPEDAAIVAIASDEVLPGAKIPVVNLDDVEAIIEIILRHACAC
jgi:hypothetical protein